MRSVDRILDRAWAGGILVPGAPVALSPDAVVVDAAGALDLAEGLGELPARHPSPLHGALRLAILDRGTHRPEIVGAAVTLREEGWWVTEAGGASPGRVVLENLAAPGRLIVGNHPELTAGGAFGCLVLPARTAELLHLDRGLPMTVTVPPICPVHVRADRAQSPDGTDLALALWATADPGAWQGHLVLMEGPGAAGLPVEDRVRCIQTLVRGGAVSVVFPGDGTAGDALETLGRGTPPTPWREGPEHALSLAWSACVPRVLPPGAAAVPQDVAALEGLTDAGVLLGESGTGTADLVARWLEASAPRSPWQAGPLRLMMASPLELRRVAAVGHLDAWLRAGGMLAGADEPLPPGPAGGTWLGTGAWSGTDAWLASPETIGRWMLARWSGEPHLSPLPVPWSGKHLPSHRGTWIEARQPDAGDPPVLWEPECTLVVPAEKQRVTVTDAARSLQGQLGPPPGVFAALRLPRTLDLGPRAEAWAQALASLGVVVVIADEWAPGVPEALAGAGVRPWTRGGNQELVLRRPEGGPAERMRVTDPLDTIHAAIHEAGGLRSWLGLHLTSRSAWTTPTETAR